MPRVVPSQVVQAIDLLFPWAKSQRDAEDDRKSIHIGAANNAAAVLELVENIPNELLVLEPSAYARFLAATSALRNQLINWNSRGGISRLERISGLGELHPITIIRNAVALCPDEAPYIGTNELDYISDIDLRDSIWGDISAVRRALTNQEWKAATILAGSTIEALLLWSLSTKSAPEIQSAISSLMANNALDKKPDTNEEEWSLHQYIHVCRKLDLISDSTRAQALLAKDFRNLVHPGRSIRLKQTCDRGTAFSAVAGIENVIRDLKT
jgi:hypothetical protein